MQGKADAAALQSESQASRQQLSELWAEAEGCQEGLEGVKASLQASNKTVHTMQDNAVSIKVSPDWLSPYQAHCRSMYTFSAC